MKKIAINFSGAIRTFEYCADSITKNIIDILKDNYEVYLFGHFWVLKDINFEFDMKWKKDCENSIIKIKKYNFSECIIEEYNDDWEKRIIQQCNGDFILNKYSEMQDDEERKSYRSYAVNCMGMYYKIMECQKLMEKYEIENNIKFDYTIRMRPDFYWNEKIPIDLISSINDKDIILVKDSYCINAKWMGNDKFFMGTSNMMKTYSRAYENILYYYKKDIRIEGQNIAKSLIEDMGLNIIFFGDDRTYDKATGKFVKQLLRSKKYK